MPIVSSTILEDAVQRDERRWITEAHTDHLGVVYFYGPYMAEPAQDVAAGLPTIAAMIEQQLADAEIAANLNEALGADL